MLRQGVSLLLDLSLAAQAQAPHVLNHLSK